MGGSAILDGYQPEPGIEPFQIERVARDNCIACDLRADYDMGIRNVRCTGLSEQCTNGLRMRSIQRDHLGFTELDHAPKPYLLRRVPDGLREGCGTSIRFPSSRAVLRIENTRRSFRSQRDQSARVENDSVRATFCGLAPDFRALSIFLAQARSFGLSVPPLFFMTSSTIARNSASFSRDF